MPRKTYAEIQDEIAKLQREAEAVRDAELAQVIDKINKAIVVYGLSPSDLSFRGASGAIAEKRNGRPAGLMLRKALSSPKKLAAAAKYRDDQGNTWVGRGPRPQWLRSALQAGRSLEDFRA